MPLYIGDTYWSYDNGTAAIVSKGKIGQQRFNWPNGVRNTMQVLYTTGKGQSTPTSPFITSVYRYGEWVELIRNNPPRYKDWSAWSFSSWGYYNRWFRVTFAGLTVYYSFGTITNPDFIPWDVEEDEEPETTWERAIQDVKSLISDLVSGFAKESLRVDIQFESSKKNLVDSLDKAATDTENKITLANDSLYLRFKRLLDSGVKGVKDELREAWNSIEDIYTEFNTLNDRVSMTISGLQGLSATLKAVAVDTIIAYSWYVINRILEAELKEMEDKEDGRDIYRDGDRTS